MEDLVRTLVTGLIVSIVFLAIAYAFWKRYDKPTEKMIEHQEGKAKMRHERKMWRAVEEQMSREKAEALFNDDFIADFERIVGTTPTFKMHDCLVMVDNRADDVVVWE